MPFVNGKGSSGEEVPRCL